MRASAHLLCLLVAWGLVPVMQAPASPPRGRAYASQTPPEGRVQLSPKELALYRQAQTLIDWTPTEVRHCPYLHGLRPAENQEQLPLILDRTGQTVALMFHNFRNTSCDEELHSASYRWDNFHANSPNISVTRRFHYIIVRKSLGDLPAFDEYRTDLKGRPLDLAAAEPGPYSFPMITADFTSTFLFLSPADQAEDHYRYLGIQLLRKRQCHVVGFAQNPQNVSRPSYVFVGNQREVILVQGLAWIDAETFQLFRLKTWLLAPRKDIGVDSQMTTVDFFPVRLNETDDALWLPRDVTVEALCRAIKLRNVHRYSNFKLFRVQSKIKSGP